MRTCSASSVIKMTLLAARLIRRALPKMCSDDSQVVGGAAEERGLLKF